MKKTRACDVLLIEDDAVRGPALEQTLRAKLRPQFNVQRLATLSGDRSGGAYEDRLLEILRRPEYSELGLIVTDRDLSALAGFPGLSEAAVSKVAGQMSIPVCVYASGKTDSFLERQRSGGGGRIILDPKDLESMASSVQVIARGFVKLRKQVKAVVGAGSGRSKYRGPASVLADLLDAREVVDHLALYTRGDQRMIAGLTPTNGNAARPVQDVRRIALALGIWLYDSILRFPGVVLDGVAAGSFLGIDGFGSNRVSKHFADALYQGPFADANDPRWWRYKLVELLRVAGADNGRTLVKQLTGKAPKPCRCSVDGRSPAGFVCVMTGEPVCDEHSVAQVSWLPRGADLARVRSDLFEEIGPWIGMT